MFKRKRKIEVLKVRNEVREVEKTDTVTGYMGGSTKTETTKKVNVTIVLAVIDGELVTREFNGKWEMADIKKWEEL